MSILTALKPRILEFLYEHWKEQPPMCGNVKEWSRTQSPVTAKIVHDQILSAQSVKVPMPTVFGEIVQGRVWDRFGRNAHYTVPERYLVSISGAKLVGKQGTVILPDGAYTIETARIEENIVRLLEYYSIVKKFTLRSVKKSGNYFSLLQLHCYTHNYYHWTHDVLQKIYLVKDFLPKDVIYIVPGNLKDWQYQTLEMLGIRREQTIAFSHKERWELENLYFCPLINPKGGHLRPALEWIRNSAYQHFGINPDATEPTERIFISRSLATGRKIVNEPEVEELLTRHGFKTYFLENLSLKDQISLFSRAEAVVAPHGAGLTNLTFAPLGTRVLEFFEPTTGAICFWSLSDCLEQPYRCLFGETVPDPRPGVQPNIFVPIEILESALPYLVGTSAATLKF